MVEIIKSDRYTKNDLQVYLKKRVKNLGLFYKILGTIPADDCFINSITETENRIYVMTYYYSVVIPTPYPHKLIIYVLDYEGNILNTFDLGDFDKGTYTLIHQENLQISAYDDNNAFFTARFALCAQIDKGGNVYYIDDSTGTAGTGDTQWDIPQGLAFNHNGQLYVCDKDNHRIKVYDIGAYQAKVTTPSAPIYVTSDELGNVYTVDNSTTDKKIYKYDKDLTAVANWAVDAGATSNLTDLVSDEINNKIYVISGETNSIKSYNRDGSGVATLISTASATNIATNGVYIVLTNNDTDIRIFDTTGNLLLSITKTGANFSTVNFYNNVVYVQNGNDIITYNIEGTNETTLISGITGAVAGFCVDTKGLIYISEVTNDVILKYNLIGEYVSTFGSVGAGDGQLNNPQGLTYNTFNAQIITADFANTRLQSFRLGKFIKKLEKSGGGAGTGAGEFTTPISICFDNVNRRMYIADKDSANRRIQCFLEGDTYFNEVTATGINVLSFSDSENVLYTLRAPITASGFDYYLCRRYTNDLVFINYFSFTKEADGKPVAYLSILGNYMLSVSTAPFDGTKNIALYEITPDYDSNWINITQDIINKEIELKYTTEENNFSLGKVDIGEFDIELLNANDKYDFESNPDSIFYSATGLYQRNNSLIKIELNGTELSRMLIDGKNITNKENVIKFKLYNAFKYFETVETSGIFTSIVDGDNISDILPILANNRFFENIIEYNASDIDIYYDAVINDVSELPDNCFDLLKALSQMGKFKFGLYAGRKFYANNIIDKMALRTADYLITENNLIDVSAYNNGEHRLFKNVEIKYTTGTATYTIPEEVQLCFNEDRTVSFDLACITSAVIAQQVADDFANFSSWASKEIEIKIPILNYDNNLFDKVYAFNIFDSTRGIKFNTLSLQPAGDILPTKETATENGRILYYPLSVKHKIGREFTTILKLKEFIADSL